MKKFLVVCLVIAFFLVLGRAGHYDRCSEIVYEMNDATYEEIYNIVGTHDEIVIAEYYLEHINDYE